MPSATLDLTQGQDLTFNVSMSPARIVTGWTVALYVSSAKVSFQFPPATLPPPGTYLWPTTPTFAILNPQVAVIPGIMPTLPTSGTTINLYRDNTANPGGGGITTLDAVNGVFQVVIAREMTLTLPAGIYFWQFWRIDPGYFGPYASGSMLAQAGR